MFKAAAAHAIVCSFIVILGLVVTRSAGVEKSSQYRQSALASSCCGEKRSLDLNIPVYAHHLKWSLILGSHSIFLTL